MLLSLLFLLLLLFNFVVVATAAVVATTAAVVAAVYIVIATAVVAATVAAAPVSVLAGSAIPATVRCCYCSSVVPCRVVCVRQHQLVPVSHGGQGVDDVC